MNLVVFCFESDVSVIVVDIMYTKTLIIRTFAYGTAQRLCCKFMLHFTHFALVLTQNFSLYAHSF